MSDIQTETLRRARACLRQSLVAMYLVDLEAYHDGDKDRFTRMVDGRGKQIGDYDQWVGYVRDGLADPDSQDLELDRWIMNRQRAVALGIVEKGHNER